MSNHRIARMSDAELVTWLNVVADQIDLPNNIYSEETLIRLLNEMNKRGLAR